MSYACAIIGLGQIASRYQEDPRRGKTATHAAAMAAHPQCRLVAGYDPDAGQRRRFARAWPGTRVYDDLDALLATECPAIIGLATPVETHAALLRRLLRYRPRALLCEKPLCRNAQELQQLRRMWSALGRDRPIVTCNCTRRWDPLHQWTAQQLRRGRIGRLQTVHTLYSGNFLSTSAHLLDELRMLLGEVAWVHAASTGTADALNGWIGFRSGATAVLQWIDARGYLSYEIDCYGTTGRLRLGQSGFQLESWRTTKHPHFSGYRALTPCRMRHPTGHPGDLAPVIADLVRCIRQRKRPLCTMEDAFRTATLQFALLRSAARGGVRLAV
ncbi:MAG: Gfo/Idh/MocA family oxidoreductase [Deltaproteobacteria bacterium]|nr:Gfo/Idh/MocA family oxidoreductase [Deltaproteobacteria bacterium]